MKSNLKDFFTNLGSHFQTSTISVNDDMRTTKYNLLLTDDYTHEYVIKGKGKKDKGQSIKKVQRKAYCTVSFTNKFFIEDIDCEQALNYLNQCDIIVASHDYISNDYFKEKIIKILTSKLIDIDLEATHLSKMLTIERKIDKEVAKNKRKI